MFKINAFVSACVRLWPSRVRTRAKCFRPDSWLVEVYRKASSYPLKRDYWFFPLSIDLPKGFTQRTSHKALPQRVELCEFDGSRKLDYCLSLCTVSGDKDVLQPVTSCAAVTASDLHLALCRCTENVPNEQRQSRVVFPNIITVLLCTYSCFVTENTMYHCVSDTASLFSAVLTRMVNKG